MTENCKFNLDISSIELNCLMRNLNRKFLTVIGEAVSNSWDADANNVRISFDRENSSLTITDDGKGMTSEEFQENFLNVGHSMKEIGGRTMQKNRPSIGSKGLGMLSFLSYSERMTIVTKTESTDCVGGTIDFRDLEKVVMDNSKSNNYVLEVLDAAKFNNSTLGSDQGTMVHLENIDLDKITDIWRIKEDIAMHLRFSLIDPEFNIHVNGELVTLNDLKQVSDSTEFCWMINDFSDPFIESLGENVVKGNLESKFKIKGFLATFKLPKRYHSSGSSKCTLDLFVNGRLREKNILRRISNSPFLAEFVYGQIHFDDLEENGVDPYATNREEVLEINERFQEFIVEIKRIVGVRFENEWECQRLRNFIENYPVYEENMSSFEITSMEMFNESVYILNKKFDSQDNFLNEIKYLKNKACKNSMFYRNIFIVENLLRKIIVEYKIQIDEKYEDKIFGFHSNEKKYKKNTDTDSDFEIRDLKSDLEYLSIRNLSDILVENIPELGEDFTIHTYKIAMYRNVFAHTGNLSEGAEVEFKLLFPTIFSTTKELLEKKRIDPPDSEE